MMNKIYGVVLSNSYYYKNRENRFIINFPLQVDRKITIYGKVMVQITSPIPLEFKIGKRVIIEGRVFYEKGCWLKASNYQISL